MWIHPLDLSPSIFAWPSAPCVSMSPFLSHQDTVIGCVEKTHSSVCLLDSHVTTTLHTPDTTCTVLPLPCRSLRDQRDVLQFISVVTLTRARADPAGEGLSPQDRPPLQMPVASNRSPRYPRLLSDLATNWRSHDPVLGLDDLPEQLTELRETLNIYHLAI